LPKPSNESTLSCFLPCCKEEEEEEEEEEDDDDDDDVYSHRKFIANHYQNKTNRCKIQSGPRLACIDSQTLPLDIHLTLSTGYLTLVWLITYYSSDQSLATLLYFLGSKWHVKIRCPDCKEAAELADDFSFVKCSNCSFDMTYGEYVKYIAYKDARYRDILSDYK
jgi:hypothetical protein